MKSTSVHSADQRETRIERGHTSRLRRNALVIPLVGFFVLAFATVFGCYIIKEEQKKHQLFDIHQSIAFFTSKLNSELSMRLLVGELIQHDWRDTLDHSKDSFRAIVTPKLKRFSDIQAINWIDENGTIRWVNPEQGNEAALGFNVRSNEAAKKAFDAAKRSGQMTVAAPVRLVQGSKGFVIYIPFSESGREKGMINIVLRVNPLVDHVLSKQEMEDYALTVTCDDEVVFQHGKAAPDTHLTVKEKINIADREWVVTGSATERYIGEASTLSVEGYLGIGLLISFILSLLLRLLTIRHVEVHESQRRFADFADVSSDWFWETDENLRFSYFSSRFEEVTSYSPELLLGKTRAEIGAPGANPVAYRNMLEDMKNHLPIRNFEYYKVKPTGEIVYLSISGRPIFDDDGIFLEYRGIGRDITEQFLSQQALNDALALSEKANQAKTEFLATMSHEFRTPLNAILGFSEMLRSQYFGPLGADNYKEYASDIHRSGKHMLELVNDILDISAIEANKRNIMKEDVALVEFVYEAIKNVQTDAQEAGLEIEVNVPDTLPNISADKRSVLQIIMNLLSNAVKFSKPGGKIVINAIEKEAVVQLSVADTGIGIDEETLPKVLDPFAQSQSNPHLAEVGTGLGLTIVKALMETHGGTIQIESEVGVGTTVILEFPK